MKFWRAYPALLRIGLAEAVAYRAEFVVWMLTTTMPLVMLALWTAVARDAPFGRFGRDDFVAYYLATFIVRTVAGSWVVWEMNQEIRTGTLGLRLLRPIHPFVAYSAEHLAAIPLRSLLALPIAIVLLWTTKGARLAHDPVAIALVPVSLAGAWLITFISMLVLGSLSLFLERSLALFEVWLGAFSVLSGYLVPLELMPRWLFHAAQCLPFRYMLGFPVELMIGMTTRAEAIAGVATQAAYIVAIGLLAQFVWSRGIRRFEAYGA